VRSDRAAGAAHVLDDDRLIQHAAHAVGDDAGHDIARPARREGHDHCDRPRRVIVGARCRSQTTDAGDETNGDRHRLFPETHLHHPYRNVHPFLFCFVGGLDRSFYSTLMLAALIIGHHFFTSAC
jgi:hypothetical protein